MAFFFAVNFFPMSGRPKQAPAAGSSLNWTDSRQSACVDATAGALRAGRGGGLQCSHLYSRRHLATRFDLRNCNAMCAGCNRRHSSDPDEYLRFMNEYYGANVVAELDGLRADTRKVTDEELARVLERFKRMADGAGGFVRDVDDLTETVSGQRRWRVLIRRRTPL